MCVKHDQELRFETSMEGILCVQVAVDVLRIGGAQFMMTSLARVNVCVYTLRERIPM